MYQNNKKIFFDSEYEIKNLENYKKYCFFMSSNYDITLWYYTRSISVDIKLLSTARSTPHPLEIPVNDSFISGLKML